MNTELKSCPFCGGKADEDFEEHLYGDGVYVAYCTTEGCALAGDDFWMATEKWNDRPIEDALRAERDGYKAQFDLMLPQYTKDHAEVATLREELASETRWANDYHKQAEKLQEENDRLKESLDRAHAGDGYKNLTLVKELLVALDLEQTPPEKQVDMALRRVQSLKNALQTALGELMEARRPKKKGR